MTCALDIKNNIKEREWIDQCQEMKYEVKIQENAAMCT